jgi:pSer/pThr/pTyr-binding forkhead associated (FHA) protein
MSSTPGAADETVLEVTSSAGTVRIPAAGTLVRVGRSADNNDIVLDAEPAVSRHHAEFVYDDDAGGWSVRDLSSHNGTFVNCVRLEGVSAAPVTPADVVTVGDVTIRLTA